MTKRRNLTPKFKAKVALEALREEFTLPELARKTAEIGIRIAKAVKQARTPTLTNSRNGLNFTRAFIANCAMTINWHGTTFAIRRPTMGHLIGQSQQSKA